MGAIFYRPLFALFGFSPFPFRLCCFVLLTGNLYVAWLFVKRLTGSIQIALLSILMFAFHPRLVDLYSNTGDIYDIACFSFFFAAFAFYLGIRWDHTLPNAKQSSGFLFLYICALNAKEIAVALPALILIHELIYSPPDLHRMVRWLKTNGRLALTAALLTVPYIWGKLHPASPLAQLDRYRPRANWHQFLCTYGAYLDQLFYQDGWFTETRTALVLMSALLLALVLRSRHLLFAWCLAVVGALPIAFIPPRPLAAFYIPLLGLTTYAAIVLAGIAESVIRQEISFRGIRFRELLIFLVVLVLLLRAHRVQRHNMAATAICGQPLVRATLTELQQQHVRFPRGARVLAIHDPFRAGGYDLLLMLWLYSHDPALKVDHADVDDNRHDVVMRWTGMRLLISRPLSSRRRTHYFDFRNTGMKPPGGPVSEPSSWIVITIFPASPLQSRLSLSPSAA